DDGSQDDSAALANQMGATLLKTTTGRLGPGAARNQGAQHAKGDVLYFIDADCEIHADTLANIHQIFQAEPTIDALIGSYDDSPAAPNFLAQYKNLFHHYVHQSSQAEASTFWGACGAIKRLRFLELGGFDVNLYQRPAVEDIELGYRLKQAGGRIRLAKQVQIKHLKAWRWKSLLKADIFDRGIPWTQLLMKYKAFMSDLNLQTHNRVSVVAVYGLLAAIGVALFQPQTIWIAVGLEILLLWLNWPLYRFFYEKRGLFFALRVIPMHWLYYFYNAISFGCGVLLHWQAQAKTPSSLPPLADRAEIDRN
ncbi:MAG: glycosyltransferase, partial [Chloroflexota bacterium]